MSDLFRRSGATISDCGLYRYNLWRTWGSGPTALFIMLNPSTADAEADDPTIRRCIGFAKSLGCGSIQVANLFAFRATKPADMRAAADPVGPRNEGIIKFVAKAIVGPVICAWGAHGGYRDQDRRVLDWLREAGAEPMALKVTRNGFPSHPLYLPGDAVPTPYEGRPA